MAVWCPPACFYNYCSCVWSYISWTAAGGGGWCPSDWSRCTSSPSPAWPRDLRGRSRGPACSQNISPRWATVLHSAHWSGCKNIRTEKKEKISIKFYYVWPCFMGSLWLEKLLDQYIFNLWRSCEKRKNTRDNDRRDSWSRDFCPNPTIGL